MRNGPQTERTSNFLSKYYLPCAERLGIGPVGCFSAMIGAESPFFLVLTSYPSAGAFAAGQERMASDKAFQKGFEEYNAMAELSYIRMENSLLRSFDSVPAIALPPAGGQPSRIFE